MSQYHSLIVESAQSGFKLAYYPFSFFVFLLWSTFTAVLISLLQLAAVAANTPDQPSLS